jgi:hypothetical protein
MSDLHVELLNANEDPLSAMHASLSSPRPLFQVLPRRCVWRSWMLWCVYALFCTGLSIVGVARIHRGCGSRDVICASTYDLYLESAIASSPTPWCNYTVTALHLVSSNSLGCTLQVDWCRDTPLISGRPFPGLFLCHNTWNDEHTCAIHDESRSSFSHAQCISDVIVLVTFAIVALASTAMSIHDYRRGSR